MAKITKENTTEVVKPALSDAELGLADDDVVVKETTTPAEPKLENVEKATEVVEPTLTSKEKVEKAQLDAAANAAVKAAVTANSEMSAREAEKMYLIEKKKDMLNRCKSDRKVKFIGQKIFANYFGKDYTFLYNGIPVTVRFDGTEQEFPEFIYNRLMKKINQVSDSNTSKENIEYR